MNDLELIDVKLVAEQEFNWERLTNKTVLLSGGTGFIGSFIINVFRYRNKYHNQGIKVISLSRRGGNSDSNIKYVKADITKEIKIEEHVDFVLHLASNTHPKQYGSDPVGTITTNVIGCNNLLSFSSLNHVERFLLASSVEIYGEGSNFPMNELYSGYINCNDARSGYNEAKRTCEALCQSYKSQYNIDIVIARLSRVFGADTKDDSKAMAQFMSKAVAGKDILLKSKGNQRYSYCYVADAASGILKVLLDGKNGEAYNISDDDENLTLREYANYLANISGNKVNMQIEENKNTSKSINAILDTNKIKQLGWHPIFTVSDALMRTYKIYKERILKN